MIAAGAGRAQADSPGLVYYADAGRPGNTGDGRSWATAKKTLQAAIDTTTTAHEVWARQGKYSEAVALKSGVALYGGFTGQETTRDTRSADPNLTEISAGESYGIVYHTVTISGCVNTRLDGFRISHGVALGGLDDGNGGGIFCRDLDATTVIENCVICFNGAGRNDRSSYGGGIYCLGASPRINRCRIQGNTVSYRDSGGGGIALVKSAPEISDCLLACNSANFGGALYASESTPTLRRCAIWANIAQNNPLYQSPPSSPASDSRGGGLHFEKSTPLLIDCMLGHNQAIMGGGLNTSQAQPTLVNCLLIGNKASRAAAIYHDSPLPLVLKNCNVYGNDALYNGSVYSANNRDQFYNTIFANNPAGGILGYYASKGITRNCLFYGNTTFEFRDGSATALYHDASTINLQVAGSAGNVSGDPLFVMDGPDAQTGIWTANSVFTGTSTIPQYQLTDDVASFTPHRLAGQVIQTKTGKGKEALIVDNTTSTVLVIGNLDSSGNPETVQTGEAWRLLDFHLRDGSMALDLGTSEAAPAADCEGTPRPGADGLVDIGMYEAPDALTPPADTTPPGSRVNAILALATSSTLTLTVTAVDDRSGVRGVRLFYRRNGGDWTQYRDEVTTISGKLATFQLDFTQTGGNGRYEFYSLAIDGIGNTESAPATADQSIRVAYQFPDNRIFVDQQAQGSGCGDDWADACHDIGTGLTLAALSGLKEIWVAAGTYPEAITFQSGVALFGGFTGARGLAETDLTQRDPAAHPTIIDASHAAAGKPAQHVVTLNKIPDFRLDGFTLTGGKADRAIRGLGVGGGLDCEYSTGTLQRCIILGNQASNAGCGVYADHSTLEFIDCTIAGNDYNWYSPTGSPSGYTPAGGGICSQYGSLRMERCTISANKAYYSAGLYIGMTQTTLRNCLISGNEDSVYGTIIIGSAKDSRIINCTIADNISLTGSGAIFWYPPAPEIVNTIVSGNAQWAMVCGDKLSTPTVRNCLFQGNAGGVFNVTKATTITTVSALNIQCPWSVGNIDGEPAFTPGLGGKWTAPPDYTGASGIILIDSTARLQPSALKGRLLNPDTSQRRQFYVLDNTTTTLVVAGDARDVINLARPGKLWRIMDYHIGQGSFALDRGAVESAPPTDFDGEARPGADGLVDIGADEAPPAWTAPADLTPPDSYVKSLAEFTTQTLVSLSFAVNDVLGHTREVRLFYRRNGGSWLQYPDGATAYDPAAGVIAFDTAKAGGDGLYEFYTTATDDSGNVESAPATPDTHIIVLTRFNGPRFHVAPGGRGIGDGSSWDNACARIGMALTLARTFGVKEVWVAQGRYAETVQMMSNLALYGGFAGTETNLAQRDTATHLTIIDASTVTPRYHVVTMDGITGARIDGFTLMGGWADGGAESKESGAGIYCANLDDTNVIQDCTVTHNYALFAGSGIACQKASPKIQNCRLLANIGLYGSALELKESSPSVSDCTISGNSNGKMAGGGVYSTNSPATFTNCRIFGNSAQESGGGICLTGSPSTFVNCLVAFNEARKEQVGSTSSYASYGGGFDLYDSDVSIINCSILYNHSEIHGGGLYADACVPLLINTIIDGNYKIGIEDAPSDGKRPVLKNCYFSGNSNYDLYGDKNANGAAAINALPGNSGNVDGQFYYYCLLSSPITQTPVYDAATYRTWFYNKDAHWTPGRYRGELFGARVGTGTMVLDNTTTGIQVAGDLHATPDQSIWIQNFHPMYSAPVIDRGSGDHAPAFDLDHHPRPVDIPKLGVNGTGTEFDIGAYEAQPGTPTARLYSESSLAFYNQPIEKGPTAPQPVILANDGFGPLQFIAPGITIDGPDAADFRIVDGLSTFTQPIDAGSSRTLTLAFDPTTNGHKKATLHIWTNYVDNPELTVTLTGSGTTHAPSIVTQPADLVTTSGESAKLRVELDGTPPFSCQWYKDDQTLKESARLIGVTSSTLTFQPARPGDAGQYTCHISSPYGTIISNKARLQVKPMLTIQSAYGTPSPTLGRHAYPAGVQVLAAIAGAGLEPNGRSRHDCTGWRREGVLPADGAGTSVTLTMDQDTTLTWTWRTEHQLTTAADPTQGGTVQPAGGWREAGQEVRFEATPAPGYEFAGWRGDLNGAMNAVTITIDRPTSVTAGFRRQTGAVAIEISPPTAGWVVRDADQASHTGTGSLLLTGIPTGPLELTWQAPAGYQAPADPVRKALGPGATIIIKDWLTPTAQTPERLRVRLLRCLLGLEPPAAELDLNSDGSVTAADLVKLLSGLPPTAAAQPVPADGARDLVRRVTLDWADCVRADSYRLDLWKAAETRPATATPGRLTASQFDAGALAPATEYRWQVIALNHDVATTGPVWSFTTRPNPEQLVAPNGGEHWVAGASASVHWRLNKSVAGTAARFELWRAGARVATLAETGYNTAGEDTTPVKVPAVAPGNDYRLRVISVWLDSQKDPDAWAESAGAITIDNP